MQKKCLWLQFGTPNAGNTSLAAARSVFDLQAPSEKIPKLLSGVGGGKVGWGDNGNYGGVWRGVGRGLW